ncbi:MAG: hypothetical protein PVI86_06185 [Phycisphaerae bacterium]|jgi:DNA-binding beta-propeller fold protein YncE
MLITVASLVAGMLSVAQAEPLPHLGSLTDGVRSPARLAFDPESLGTGRLFVTDPLQRHIAVFDPAGTLLQTRPIPEAPVGVAVHPDGRVFVSLRDTHKVAIYDPAFNLLGYLGESDPKVSFVGPTDIDVAPESGRIYVVDPPADRVYGFESDGVLALSLGTRGPWSGEFLYPSAIAVDEPRRRLVVADHDKTRLQVFTEDGVFLQQFGARLHSEGGGLVGWMPRPLGLAVDDQGRMYVTDALMGTVRVFDETGSELGKLADFGYEPGELRAPCDLALSPDGTRLYVASTNSSRVEIYDLESAVKLALSGARMRTEKHPVVEQTDLEREGSWDGPHIVEDRPSLCAPCHGITGQPGMHGGTIEGQATLCMSCHTAGGRALDFAIYERDMADPYGTNANAADGRGRSHAWGVPAVNEDADSIGPAPDGAMASYLDDDGLIKCSTCHNQHNTNYGPDYLRVSNDADAMCKECHAPRNKGLDEGGSHPVGFAYPAGTDEYPSADALAPLQLKNANIECSTCHAPHAADSGRANDGDGDGMLLLARNDETLCQVCHTEHMIHDVEGAWQPTCRECHDIHDPDNPNITLIARQIDGTAVSFLGSEAACAEQGDFVHAACDPPGYDGVCEVCHTETDHHRNSPELDHDHNIDAMCTDCHLHSLGFLPTCIACHGEPPDGTETPNRAGAHAAHLTLARGPSIADCETCHTSSEVRDHDNGLIGFASGFDADFDGNIDLSETDVCDECHSPDGPFDGVDDPVIGAKANWYTGVYTNDVLDPDKADWCLGCHDVPGSIIDEVTAPSVAGNNETWGYKLEGHGLNDVLCADCHDPTLPHIDGVEQTFTLVFPLSPFGSPERLLDQQAYNAGYRLRPIDGQQALAVPREAGPYTPDDFRLCFECHDEMKLLGVPSNYGWQFSGPPPELLLSPGVAQTNYRNEREWGYAWHDNFEKPANPHWNHIGWQGPNWTLDDDNNVFDSRVQCVTCHSPHAVQAAGGGPAPAMTRADLAITYDVYNDGTTDHDYAYIATSAYFEPGGDLYCWPCHPWAGAGPDPPFNPPQGQTRYYRTLLDLPKRTCVMCHKSGRDAEATQALEPGLRSDAPMGRAGACRVAPDTTPDADCLTCHDMSGHRQGRTLMTTPRKWQRDHRNRLRTTR